MQSIQHALDTLIPSESDPKAVVKRANWLLNELDQEAISTEDQVALTTILNTNLTQQAKMELQKAILHLRDDHINITNELLGVKIRVSKLEDNVRALTAQRYAAQDSPRMAQEIEAITRYGRTVVLKIPKGQALVPLRASRSLTPTPPNHRADSAPNSQVSEDDAVVDGADQPTSSQSDSEIPTQPEVSKTQNLEKVSFITRAEFQTPTDQNILQPLPPVPAAAAYPANPYIKPEPLRNAWESGNSQPSSAAPQNSINTTTSPWGTSTLSAIPPVQIAPDTPRVGGESAPLPKSKGKKKKWTDPPIFQDSQTSTSGYDAEDTKNNTKTLFSHHDGGEASTSGRDTTVRPEAHEQTIAQPESTSPLRDVTNQTAASSSSESNTLAQPARSRNETPNNKRLFGDLLRDNNAKHGQRLPPQLTATQTSAQSAPAPTPAPAPQRAGAFSSPDAMRSIMQSVAARANYVTTPEAATASRENTVPRAPVNLAVTTPTAATASEARGSVTYKATASGVSGRTDTSVSSEASGSSAKSGRIAKRSAIKKVDTSSSGNQPVPAQPTAIVSPAQASFSSSEQVASTVSLAAAPQSPNVSTPTASVTAPAAILRSSTMNASVASFHPSTSFTNNATHTASPALPNGPMFESLRQQMTAEAYARFTQSTNNVQT